MVTSGPGGALFRVENKASGPFLSALAYSLLCLLNIKNRFSLKFHTDSLSYPYKLDGILMGCAGCPHS